MMTASSSSTTSSATTTPTLQRRTNTLKRPQPQALSSPLSESIDGNSNVGGLLPLHNGPGRSGPSSSLLRRRRRLQRGNRVAAAAKFVLAVVVVVAVVTAIALVLVGGRQSSRRNNNNNNNNHRPDGAAVADSDRRQQQQQQRQLQDGAAGGQSNGVFDGIYDVAVAGSGPAGLTAALFAARAGLSVIVLGSVAGGMLSQTRHLDNFPAYLTSGDVDTGGGGPGWLEAARTQATRFGATFAPPGLLASSLKRERLPLPGRDVDGDDADPSYFSLQTGNGDGNNGEFDYIRAWSVILATGATPRKLGLPHEDRLWGNTLHSCAICDGHLYDGYRRPTTVMVVGGGDAAIDAALLLARHATHVIVIHRGGEDFSSAKDRANVDLLLHHNTTGSNVQIWTPYAVQEWVVDVADNSKLTGAKIRNTRDPSKSPILLDNVDGAFVMIGATPNTGWIAPPPARQEEHQQQQKGRSDGRDGGEVVQIDLDDEGLVRLIVERGAAGGATTATTMAVTASSVPGIFASGEVTDNVYKQAITAAASGAQAAIDAERWLREHKRRGGGTIPQPLLLRADGGTSGGGRKVVPNQPPQPPPPQPQKQQAQPERPANDPDDAPCDMQTEACLLSIVGRYPVVVFSKPWCPYCKKAMEALALAGVAEPHVVDLSKHSYMQAVQAALQAMTGRRTVPNVFVGGRSIGGGDETAALQQRGGLVPLLAAAGALLPPPGAARKEEEEVTEGGLADGNINEDLVAGGNSEAATAGREGEEPCDLLLEGCFREVLRRYPVVMFSLAWCPECKRSLELLERLGVRPHLIDLDDHKAISEDIRMHMQTLTKRRQVPNLFVGGEYIGGFQRMTEMHGRGELVPKLREAGVLLKV